MFVLTTLMCIYIRISDVVCGMLAEIVVCHGRGYHTLTPRRPPPLPGSPYRRRNLLCNVCRICGLCAQGALRYMMTWAYAHDMLW